MKIDDFANLFNNDCDEGGNCDKIFLIFLILVILSCCGSNCSYEKDRCGQGGYCTCDLSILILIILIICLCNGGINFNSCDDECESECVDEDDC